MRIQESGENYLETILMLEGRNGRVRSVDVANELGFTKPSISRAMGILKKAGLVDFDGEGFLVLTDSGRAKAAEVYERHRLLARYLAQVLGVPQDIAEQDACRIEHVISKETFDAIKGCLDTNSDK